MWLSTNDCIMWSILGSLRSSNCLIRRITDSVDLVFDATSAKDAKIHWEVLDKLGKIVVDMTPAKLDFICVPAVNLEEVLQNRNVNMITCGGQASIPIAYVLGKTQENVE